MLIEINKILLGEPCSVCLYVHTIHVHGVHVHVYVSSVYSVNTYSDLL